MKSLRLSVSALLIVIIAQSHAPAQNAASNANNQWLPGLALTGTTDKDSANPTTLPCNNLINSGAFTSEELYGSEIRDNTSGNSGGVQAWARMEFLNFWFKGAASPPLVTTSPDSALPALGLPGTRVLYGNQIDGGYHPGGLFTIGLGLPSCDCCSVCGVELSYLYTSMNTSRFSAFSSGTPIISRPFIDVSTGTPIAFVEGVANPAGLGIAPVSGRVTISDPSRLWGFEANGVCTLFCNSCSGFRVDLLYGFRQLAFDEDLSITENLALQDGSGERIIVNDSFSTRNMFYGGQLGLRAEKDWGIFYVNAAAKVALGDMRSTVNINGSTTDSLPGFPTVTAPGGLLAQSTNSGAHTGNSFCVIPETQINIGCNITRWLRAYVGYDYLYISQVARASSQIDLAVNSNLVPAFAGGTVLPPTTGGPARPAFVMNRTDFFAQGITVGLELRY